MKALLSAVLLIVMAGPACVLGHSQESLAPHYVNQQNPAEYINFGAGNTFTAKQGGRDFVGTYKLNGHRIVFLLDTGEKSDARLSGDHIIDHGTTWVPADPQAQSGAPASLGEQLVAQYQIPKLNVDADGCKLLQPGSVLTAQRSGVLAIPWDVQPFCPGKYQDGKISAPGILCRAMTNTNYRELQKGERLYPTSIQLDLKKAKVTLAVVSCNPDSAGNADQPPYKAAIDFQFAKGFLETASVNQVEDTINQLFTFSEDDTQQAQNTGSSQEQANADPPSIDKGQTVEQVEFALGQPEKKFNVGAKQIYVYKDVKITFVDGKVSDVQ